MITHEPVLYGALFFTFLGKYLDFPYIPVMRCIRSLALSSLLLTLPTAAFTAQGSTSASKLIEFRSSALGFSLMVPQMMEVRDAQCVKNADGTYSTTSQFLKTLVLEKDNTVAIVPEYDHVGVSADPSQGDFPWKDCRKVTASMENIDDILYQEGHFGALGWFITVKSVERHADLLPLLRTELGVSACELAGLRRGRYRKGVITFSAQAEPGAHEDARCVPPRVIIKYSPLLKKVAFWRYGYDDFSVDGSSQRMQQMLESFRFSGK